ncbi:MAG TPA: CRISPR-associated endonuclease Cas3'' [Rubrivivax sp.]|mgnify:CR=1 FL=1|nr:CRISPR-associated endonuclease Cas3'' [Rubrivivax sp.]HPO20405.1 CRISPR-associated endonuclease Cas3'' [Rubrivivax sp.]
MAASPSPADAGFIAHGPAHGLLDHLRGVAQLTAARLPTASAPWGRLAGLWHDLGKFRPGFQRYVRLDLDAHIEGRALVSADKTHSAAGAMHALDLLKARHGAHGRAGGWLLAHLIASHHHGLYDHDQLAERLLGGGAAASERERDEALAACGAATPELLDLPAQLNPAALFSAIPGMAQKEPLAQSLWLRLLFSALVDADFLDTEAYLDGTRAARRAGFAPLGDYLLRLDAHLDRLTEHTRAAGRGDDPVMRARAAVLADCRAAAQQPPGVFSLQVPTGGGKTLASLAFALRHAVAHGLERVVVAIPDTSIVEQTADVFAAVFGRDAVVEHHSQAEADPGHDTARSRLACENWDAPLVVTTNVQLLESLFAARTSRCRKLHRLQRCVIVLDEAQVLPPPFLQPTLDALRLLSAHYGSTLVSCTATQPVLADIRRFDARQSLRGLVRDGAKPVEIVREVAPLYTALERVRFAWPADWHASQEPTALAARAVAHDAVLVIVNTRKAAAELLAALDAAAPEGERTLHLSAAMCGQHRADVIAEIKARLEARGSGDARPLRVVSTQLVEAGVDLDFPVVFRALAGLDSIAQAAGRCNREGALGPRGGRVEVFVQDIPAVLATLRRAAESTVAVLGESRPETLPPPLFQRYFEHWYGRFASLDEKGIGDMLRASPDFALRLRSAADAYRLVDDENQCSVVVPYTPASGDTTARDAALAARDAAFAALHSGDAQRWQLRSLQRYLVQAPRRDVDAWLARGDVAEPLPGWYVLKDEALYHARRGLLRDGAVLEAHTLAQ